MITDSRHPDYTAERKIEWETMRDCYAGETCIKSARDKYLPSPPGWKRDLVNGPTFYQNYLQRARFPEIPSSAIRGMVGVLHGQQWQIDLPSALEYLREASTCDNLPLEAFSRRISLELLITGRYSVLAEVSQDGGEPYLCGYATESLVNWDDNFYLLQENQPVRKGFEWDTVTRSRLLTIDDAGNYMQEIYIKNELQERVVPTTRDGVGIKSIPIAVGGAIDMRVSPDVPPLIGVSRAAIASYQLYADYRHGLFMSNQDTLFLTDVTKTDLLMGSGIVNFIQSSSVDRQAKVEFISPSGQSTEAHERAMDREALSAVRSGAQLFDNTPRGQESGAARRLRFAAETANLQSIANSSAAILEKSLKNIAIMLGANPDECAVLPPQNMLEGRLEATEVSALIAAWQSGGIAFDTLFENLQRGRIASPDRTADEEDALINQRELPNSNNLV